MNNKLEQIIERRLFWADFSVNLVLDNLYSKLYNSTLFVRVDDGVSYVMKNSKARFAEGIKSCVSQRNNENHQFLPRSVITVDSLYGFTSADIFTDDNPDEKWLFVIFVKKDIFDSFFKIPYDAYEPADSLPHQVIDCLNQSVKNYLFNIQIDETRIVIENNPTDVIRHAGSSVLNSVAMCKLNNMSYSSLSETINKISYLPYEKKIIESYLQKERDLMS